MKRKKKAELPPGRVRFPRLTQEALPEIWTFQFLAAAMLLIPTRLIMWVSAYVAETSGGPLTSASFKDILLSWRLPVLLLLSILLIFMYIVVEIFAQIHMYSDILDGSQAGVRREVSKGLRSLGRFITPTGLLIILYISVAVPLCGVGFSISLTENFYIPNFIMDLIKANPLFIAVYVLLLVLLVWVGFRSIFSVHAVILDGMKPSKARKFSVRMVKENRKKFIVTMLTVMLAAALIQAVSFVLFRYLPGFGLDKLGANLPRGHFIDLSSITKADVPVLGYRILCSFAVLMGTYINSLAGLLSGAFVMLRFTRFYLDFSRDAATSWPVRPKRAFRRWRIFAVIVITAIVFLGSIGVGLFYNTLFDRDEPVRIIAHRAGGTLASENSVEGLYAAIDHDCYGSEIDVQRTQDGFYIINHDSTFKRLAGVSKQPRNMTMEEISRLRIKDTTGSGELLPVATIEEMLDVTKGRTKLFIELKGPTADKQMVDDLVRMIRERDCVGDVALISMKYSVINYAELFYPEFETGTLFFGGVGNVSKLNCDLLIMEEYSATPARVRQIHNAGKQAIVWTVNTEDGMTRFLDSEIDAVITDRIFLAERVQSELDERTDLQVIQDKIGDIWE